MRFDNFLTEGRSKVISEKEFKDLFKKNCLETHYLGPEIYRGTDNSNPFLYVNPSLSERKSPYATNQIYMLLLSNMPSWNMYPRRNRSLACSSSKEKANGYGTNMYIVFPYNQANIGVSPTDDIWYCTDKKFHITLNDINYNIEDIIYFAIGKSIQRDIKYEALLKIFSEVDEFKIRDRRGYNSEFQKLTIGAQEFFEDIGYDKPKTKLFDCLNKELSPDELGFKRTTTGHPILNKAEVWTDSECLLVEYRYYYRNLIKILDEI